MPKFLLHAVGTPDAPLYKHISEAWLDGGLVAGSQLKGHPVRITRLPDGSFSAALNLPSWMRLAGRGLRQDVIDFVASGARGFSSTEDLANTDVAVYDTDRPWAAGDPVILADDGSQSQLLPTTPRPQPVQPALPQDREGLPDQQTINILLGKGHTVLPQGQAAIAAVSGLADYQQMQSDIQTGKTDMIDLVGPRAAVGQLVMNNRLVPVETSGLDAIIEDLGLDAHNGSTGQAGMNQTQAAMMLNQVNSIVQSLGASGVVFQDEDEDDEDDEDDDISPSTPPVSGIHPMPTAQDVAALEAMVQQHGTSPQGLQAIVGQMAQNASKAPPGLHPTKAGLGTFAPTPAQAGAAHFSGPTWLFQMIEDEDMRAAGLTSLAIVSAAGWRAAKMLAREELTDAIGEDLPDCLVEESEGIFVSESDEASVRSALLATGIFAEHPLGA
jgi:hypothetical protein